MKTLIRILLVVFMFAGHSVLSPVVADDNDEKDKIAEKLDGAKEAYIKVMERYESQVNAAFDLAKPKARLAGPEAVQSVAEQKELFQKFARTPALCSTSIWSQRANAQKRWKAALDIAIRDYTLAKER
jgi:hypothetical protein